MALVNPDSYLTRRNMMMQRPEVKARDRAAGKRGSLDLLAEPHGHAARMGLQPLRFRQRYRRRADGGQ